MKRTFKIVLFLLIKSGVFAAETGKTVMEGDSVTLNPDPTQIQGFIQMLWRFEDPGPVIAQIDGNEISYTSDERFRDRLQLNQTGSLIIMNLRTKHSGLYKLDIDRSTGTSYMTFSVTVYESPSVCDAYKAKMIVSVMEGNSVSLQTDVTEIHGSELIVWRFGSEGKLIAKCDIEAKSPPVYYDERFRNRLMVENMTGSLIITNTRTTDSGFYRVKISSNKQTLYKRFIVTVSDSIHCCGFTEAVIRLVLSALVGVAAVAVLAYDIRSRSLQQKNSMWKSNTD